MNKTMIYISFIWAQNMDSHQKDQTEIENNLLQNDATVTQIIIRALL
jgi:hypothetical protein